MTAVAVGLTVAPAAVGVASSGGSVAHPPLPVATVPSDVSMPAQRDVGVPVIRTASAYVPVEDPTPLTSTSKSYQVQRRDTLWALAERHLGDPLRYPEIVQLNPKVIGLDNEIVPGTVLTMPSDATGLAPLGDGPPFSVTTVTEEVTVEPGDTLWDCGSSSGRQPRW